jgi:DNA-binding FadR family transcriptional regulator
VGAKTESLDRSIRDLIAGSKLGPGARLPSEPPHAEELRVGRTTIRLILMKSTTEGIIRSEHWRGYFITSVDADIAESVSE